VLTAVPAVATAYSPATGRVTKTSTTEAGTTRTITRGYDAVGRQTAYTDADGQQSTAGCDILGRTTSISDGKSTTSLGYDATTGRLTTMSVGGIGTSSVAYEYWRGQRDFGRLTGALIVVRRVDQPSSRDRARSSTRRDQRS
jgi:YD repeat-containing protein